jgi:triosephosphate isomerase
MGMFEKDAYSRGTFAIARSVADAYATTIVGGGDTDVAVHKAGVSDSITFISTGGGASLELLEGKELPGLAALTDDKVMVVTETGSGDAAVHDLRVICRRVPCRVLKCARILKSKGGDTMNKQRKPIIAGNWKMNKTSTEARDLASKLIPLVSGVKDRDIVLAPPFTSIPAVAETIKGTNMALSAQDLFWEEKGAFTGEISAEMLLDLGCKYVIIGHSERRQFFGETEETVNKKVRQALNKGLLPIVCVGELLSEREAGKANEVIERQVVGALKGVAAAEMQKIVIAYEPVWAIGTGKTATPDQANEIHAFIRQKIKSMYNGDVAGSLRIQYGGSVTPENVSTLMAKPDIDGALVGGASLKPESFAALVNLTTFFNNNETLSCVPKASLSHSASLRK